MAGALSIAFWFQAVGLTVGLTRSVAFVCGPTIAYTLDKIADNEEDANGAGYDRGAFSRNKRGALALCAVAAVVFAACGCRYPDLFVSSALASALAIFYVRPLPKMRGRRIKNLFPLAKMFFVAVMWVGWGILAHDTRPSTQLQRNAILLLSLVIMCKVSFFDIKDIAADQRAGIVTFATLFGERTTMCVVRAAYAFVGVTGLCLLPDVRDGIVICAWMIFAQHVLGRVPRHVVLDGAAAFDLQIVDLMAPWMLRRML